ncbi:tripeptidyl-peptidase sed4 [Apiospora aurea]|uniref:Tripeptidyl-peptidase sed4 n=1 Tax=Apiospora aurea TaxID=335848 RepID=A0ABR1QLJ9_9PEZI
MNHNNPYPSKGTSASTPVVAAMITLLNDVRQKKGMTVLGFLNPLLYAAGVAEAAFQDIAENNINGCSTRDHQQPGFQATKGWDAASGLGAPDFAKLRKLLTQVDLVLQEDIKTWMTYEIETMRSLPMTFCLSAPFGWSNDALLADVSSILLASALWGSWFSTGVFESLPSRRSCTSLRQSFVV